MLRYPTPSDHRYGDATNNAMPQGNNTYWAPGGLDTSQPAVTRDPEDRHGPSRLRASQLAYASPTPPFSLTHRDSYPALSQAQTDCPEQFTYHPQQYVSSVNYAGPPYDLAEYPILPGSAYHSGQYPTQASAAVTHFEYPPSDPTSFHHTTTYDPTGYINADAQYGLPLGSQHQQNLVPDPSVYIRCGDSFDHYETVTQHPVLPIPPSSSSSELGNALMEIATPEPQSTSRSSISLPSLPLPSQHAPKHEPSGGVIGLNPVKTEYGATPSGQPFSPMAPLGSPSLTSDHAPFKKEEDQESPHVGAPSMPRTSTPLHVHSSLRHRPHPHDSFRLVQDPAAFPGFAPPTKRHPPPPSLSISSSHSYSPGARIPTPRSSSFSSSDTGTPTSTVTLMDNTSATPLPTPTLVPNPKAGQGVLKLPSTKRSARRKPAIACLFCRERKIACGAPPVGSADTTCNQCARRSRKCEYPTMSRRGLHKRRDNSGAHHRESEDADYVPTT